MRLQDSAETGTGANYLAARRNYLLSFYGSASTNVVQNDNANRNSVSR